jgi:uncharacterized protein YegP (UPF0339 family)
MSKKPDWLVALQKSRADETTVEMPAGKLRVYRDLVREWRWNIKASNGKIVADSGEGYNRLDSLLKGLQRAKAILATV